MTTITKSRTGNAASTQRMNRVEDSWKDWASTRRARLRYAEWQVIYPELGVVSLEELAEGGSMALFKARGESDDEILAALIALGQAGDNDAFMTAAYLLNRRESRVVGARRSSFDDRSYYGFEAVEAKELVQSSTFELLATWDLENNSAFIGRNFMRALARAMNSYHQKDEHFFLSGERAPSLVRAGHLLDMADVYTGLYGSPEEVVVFWSAVERVLDSKIVGSDPVTKALMYESIVNGLTPTEACQRVGVEYEFGRKRIARAGRAVRERMPELAKAA